MIWMILRSRKGLSTTQHRLLVGLCISDILLSLSWSTFNFTAPSELDYMVWNARGNEATCRAQGFLYYLGGYGGIFYNVSLNLYFLAVVKYEKSDEYIRSKIEPFLHGVTIVLVLIWCIFLLVKNQYHNFGVSGICTVGVNYPPHCVGYSVGEVRPGFEIACGSGLEGADISSIVAVSVGIVSFPVMIICLGMIYRTVRKQERKVAKYGINSLTSLRSRSIHTQQSASTLFKKKKKTIKPITTRSNNARSQSRAVMHKAFGYFFAWLLSHGMAIIYYVVHFIVFVAAKKHHLVVLAYIISIFHPLQGLFNLLIFMFPKIVAAKNSRRENLSWRQAFWRALWSRGNDRKKHALRNSNLRSKQHSKKKKKKNVNGLVPFEFAMNNPDAPPPEEEKCEIQMPNDDIITHKKQLCSNYVPNIAPAMESKDPEIAEEIRQSEMRCDECSCR